MLTGIFGYNTTIPATLTAPESVIFMAYSWEQFWNLADGVFNPLNVQADATIKLDKLQQEKMSAEELFIEFNILAATASYAETHFDLLKIHFANQHLNNALIANIHNIAIFLTSWEAYKQ
jgi:hypothetical protein